MIMKMRGDKCTHDQEEWVKIPLLPINVRKRTRTRVTTNNDSYCKQMRVSYDMNYDQSDLVSLLTDLGGVGGWVSVCVFILIASALSMLCHLYIIYVKTEALELEDLNIL